jgi:hypothetical protein
MNRKMIKFMRKINKRARTQIDNIWQKIIERRIVDYPPHFENRLKKRTVQRNMERETLNHRY